MKARPLAVAVAIATTVLGGCDTLRYPPETHTIDGRPMHVTTQNCIPSRIDCFVNVKPTLTPDVDWTPNAVVTERGGGRILHWRLSSTGDWTFADPGIEFKTADGRNVISRCQSTRYLVQCQNSGTPGTYEYKIRVLQGGTGNPVEKDPWVMNR